MPIVFNGKVFNYFQFKKEADFEMLVEKIADNIFGTSTIYISKKKRIKGSKIISIPDGYLIDMTEPSNPLLFVIENEIVSHDPFKHIGIQLLQFATSFKEARLELRNHLMAAITSDKQKLLRLETACGKSAHRNIDNYLDSAVYGEFKALVLIDEAREELHNVIQKINAEISVLEVKAFISEKKEFIYQYDTLYDEDEMDIPVTGSKSTTAQTEARLKRRERRALCDTIVVPAQEEGFKTEFLVNKQWYAIRIGAAMKDRIKYIAAYQVAPISAITHIAEVEAILPYQNTGKYLVKFKNDAKQIKGIKLKNPDKKPQGPVYIKYDDLAKAKSIDDLIKY